MTSNEFRDLLEHQNDQQLLDPCLREDQAPYVFEPMPDTWDQFRDVLVTNLRVSRADIRVVGSGRFGFSLKPGHKLRSFRDKSDIDVVIVNPDLFEELWIALLGAAYPRSPITEKFTGWLAERRNELYTGWLTPRDIKLDIRILGNRARAALNFKTQWFNAVKLASRYPPRRHADITSRLYHSWQHAELYHLHSLSELRKSLAKERI